MAETTKIAPRRPRFKLHTFNEICRMSPTEWNDECRRNGADMEETPEDQALRELVALRAMKLVKTETPTKYETAVNLKTAPGKAGAISRCKSGLGKASEPPGRECCVRRRKEPL